MTPTQSSAPRLTCLLSTILWLVPASGGPDLEPQVVLWAWERPERLEFLDPKKIGVAFLAETLLLEGDELVSQPRRQPLVMPPGTRAIAVVRVESSQRRAPSLKPPQRAALAARIIAIVQRTGVNALQIDFDALQSQRLFYGDLLTGLRHRLPAGTSLTMTALASWCMDDPWIADLPIDEAVPMLFSMGPEGPSILRRLEGGAEFPVGLCRSSLGISVLEPWPFRASGNRVWVFSPKPWSAGSLARVQVGLAARRP